MSEIIFQCSKCDNKEVFQVDTYDNVWSMAYFLSENRGPICIDCDEEMVLQESEKMKLKCAGCDEEREEDDLDDDGLCVKCLEEKDDEENDDEENDDKNILQPM